MRRILVSSLLMLAYVVGCVVLAFVFQIDKTVIFSAALSFVLASILAFYFQKFLHTHTGHEKERVLIRQVFEGSRGARLITDSVDNIVFSNHKFDELFGVITSNPIDALASLFVENSQAQSHFHSLAEQAQIPDSIELKSTNGDRETWFLVAAQPVYGWLGMSTGGLMM